MVVIVIFVIILSDFSDFALDDLLGGGHDGGKSAQNHDEHSENDDASDDFARFAIDGVLGFTCMTSPTGFVNRGEGIFDIEGLRIFAHFFVFSISHIYILPHFSNLW